MTAIDLDKAKLDPASVFDTPKDVLAAPGISAADKQAILVRWESDAEALMRATEEGMPPAENRAPGEGRASSDAKACSGREQHRRSLRPSEQAPHFPRCFEARIARPPVLARPQAHAKRKDLPMNTELNATEARQATKRPRAMIWVLTVSLLLALIAGLALAVGWIGLPG